MRRFIFLGFISFVLFSVKGFAAQPPKFVIYLVFDQMRADYLLKYRSEFKSAISKTNGLGGFAYLMEKGAYYPYAQYEVLQNMTCPGHAMISTGSWPINTGISMNDWYSRNTEKLEYCVDDSKDGISPRKLLTTTVSDEFKNLDKPSKVFGVALKDRSAVMLAGHRADGAFWFNEKKWIWESSSYYKESPKWILDHNKKLMPKIADKSLFLTNWGTETTINMAIDLIKNENLGKTKGTDFLFLSFSTHDLAGHEYGPNSEEMKKLTLGEDRELSRFLNFLNQKFNLNENVEIILTADHGIPSSVEYSQKNKIAADHLDEIKIVENIYSELNKKYSPNEKQEWFTSMRLFHFFVNLKTLNKLKIDKKEFLETSRELLLKENLAEEILIPSNFKNQLPVSTQLRNQVQNSYVESQWGDLILVPRPYYMNKGKTYTVNHLTGYVYDRTVPLIFFGKNFKTGLFYQKVFVVDIAPTVAATLGSLPGAKSDGRMLHEILKSN